jgi:hypothetical protein
VAGGAAAGGLVMSSHLQSPAASGTELSMVMGACPATLEPCRTFSKR